MSAAPLPTNEDERLKALRRYQILDTPEEAMFDRITSLAKSVFETPIALISLVDKDRQWFKSKAGLDVKETPREHAICAYAIFENKVVVVQDAQKDPRFANSPLVTGEPRIRFYAGAPIRTFDGFPLGTLCIIDRNPRSFSRDDIGHLRMLARHAMYEIELRYANGGAPSAESA
ncbi:MAG: GAF domain-containing protein [Pseudomonadota bacterium]